MKFKKLNEDTNKSTIEQDILAIEDINEFLKVVNIETHKEPSMVGPMYLLKDGSFIYVNDYVSKNKYDSENNRTHTGFIGLMMDEYIENKYNFNPNNIYLSPHTIRGILEENGLIRLNTGTTASDNRFYMCLPSGDYAKPTYAQYNSLLEFLDLNTKEVWVYIGNKWDAVSQKYVDYIPEDVIKKIKRYYASGNLYESLNEAYFEGDWDEIYDTLMDYEEDKPKLGPGFITEDGTFINLPEDSMHGDIFGDEDYESEDFYTLEDAFHLIKMNTGNKYEKFPYIDIWYIPNTKQKYSIIEWFDFLQANGKKEVWVNSGNFDKKYSFDKYISDEIIKDVIRLISSGKDYGTLYESLDADTITLYTIQDEKVLDKLNKGETYIADYKNIFDKDYVDLYKKLSSLYNFKNCPIFCVDEDSMHVIGSSGIIEGGDKILLKLNVPISEVKYHDYYDWTDYLFFSVDDDGTFENEEDQNNYVLELEDNIKNQKCDNTEDREFVIDRIEPSWLNRDTLQESYTNENEEYWYRGYNSKYGIFDNGVEAASLYTWVTDSLEYANEYAEHNYGKVAKIKLKCSDNAIGSVMELPEYIDYYEPGDEAFKEYILDNDFKGYGFEIDDWNAYCLCISKEVCEVVDEDVKVDNESLQERTNINYSQLTKPTVMYPYNRYWFGITIKQDKDKPNKIKRNKFAIQLQTDDIDIVKEILEEIIPKEDYDRMRILGHTSNLSELRKDGYKLLSLGLSEELNEDYDTFKNSLHFPLFIMRGIYVRSKKDIDLKNIGKSWTVNPNLFISTDATLGNYIPANECNYILSGYVNEDDIDWKETEERFYQFSDKYYIDEDDFDYDTELEIVLKNNVIPNNLKIESRKQFFSESLNEGDNTLAPHTIRSLMFKTEDSIEASPFTDFIEEGLSKLDENIYIYFWHDSKSHNTMLIELGNKYNIIEERTFTIYMNSEGTINEVNIDRAFEGEFAPYKEKVIAKAKNYLRTTR